MNFDEGLCVSWGEKYMFRKGAEEEGRVGEGWREKGKVVGPGGVGFYRREITPIPSVIYPYPKQLFILHWTLFNVEHETIWKINLFLYLSMFSRNKILCASSPFFLILVLKKFEESIWFSLEKKRKCWRTIKILSTEFYRHFWDFQGRTMFHTTKMMIFNRGFFLQVTCEIYLFSIFCIANIDKFDNLITTKWTFLPSTLWCRNILFK